MDGEIDNLPGRAGLAALPFDEPPPSVAELEAVPLALEPPDPGAVRSLHLSEAADRAERLLARLARARGAVDVAIGEGLAALSEGERLAVLCFSSVGDYARECLGIAGRTAQKMVHLARELRSRPLLDAALRAGEITVCKAEAILPVARGDAEAGWVERARSDTVRALTRAVREEAGAGESEEEWLRFRVRCEPGDRVKIDEALSLAGKILGATSTRWQRLEAMCQEYLGSHPIEVSDGKCLPSEFGRRDRRLETLQEQLEAETERWAMLQEPAPHRAPAEGLAGETDPGRIDWRLRELVAMRARWDAAMGWLGLVVKRSRIWRILGFATFRRYSEERLGLAARTVEQRIALEERLWELPALRQAVTDGLSYEKARLVARCRDDQVEGAIARAWEQTCIQLRRSLDAERDRQMSAGQVFSAPVPEGVAHLLADAVRAVRAHEGKVLPVGKCLAKLAEEFIATHEPALSARRSRSQRIRDRDGGFCRVPGCSRAADDAHHRRFRSHGGGHQGVNLVSVCSFHHHRCIHEGRLVVRGRAPDGLLWFQGRPRVLRA